MTLPNFLIIGQAKCGTTAIYHALKNHPQVFMSPVKEPRFFAFKDNPPHFEGPMGDVINRVAITQLEAYQALFSAVSDETAIGEASPIYSHWRYAEISARNIQQHIPDARLIVILRQPAERAYSAYNYRRQILAEPFKDIRQAFAAEGSPIRANWTPVSTYVQTGFYYEPMKVYYDIFPRCQIRVYLYEDWNKNPLNILRDIFDYLYIDPIFTLEMVQRYNTTWLPYNERLHWFLSVPHPIKKLFKPLLPQTIRRRVIAGLKQRNQFRPLPMDTELRRELTAQYREDILKLQDLIEQDLSQWLAP